MPIRTDKIYNRDTDQYIDTENLLKYEPSDNTIRTLIDQILIKLDEIEGLNLVEINVSLSEWIKKIDDIQNEYNKLYNLLTNLADTTIVQQYLDEINEITDKIDNIQKQIEDNLKNLENEIQKTQENLDSFKDNINNKLDETQNTLNKILNPEIQIFAKKIFILKDYSYAFRRNIKKIWKYPGFLTQTRGSATKTVKISRGVFESGNTYLEYAFTDAESTNYFKLINPKTGKSQQFNDCGSSSGTNLSYCYLHNVDLRYLLEEQDDDEVEVTFEVYQGDVPGFGYLTICSESFPCTDNAQKLNPPSNLEIKFLQNSVSQIIDARKMTEYKGQFEAIALADLKSNNYPLKYTSDFNKASGKSVYFQLLPLIGEEFEFGILVKNCQGLKVNFKSDKGTKNLIDTDKSYSLNWIKTNVNLSEFSTVNLEYLGNDLLYSTDFFEDKFFTGAGYVKYLKFDKLIDVKDFNKFYLYNIIINENHTNEKCILSFTDDTKIFYYYTGTESAKDFYNYNNASSNNSSIQFEKTFTLIPYFYNGKYSLIGVLDKIDGFDGNIRFSFEANDDAVISISDNGDEITRSGNKFIGRFNWASCCTDGFVIDNIDFLQLKNFVITSTQNIEQIVIITNEGKKTIPVTSFPMDITNFLTKSAEDKFKVTFDSKTLKFYEGNEVVKSINTNYPLNIEYNSNKELKINGNLITTLDQAYNIKFCKNNYSKNVKVFGSPKSLTQQKVIFGELEIYKNNAFEILDFYFRSKDYDPVYKFKSQNSETLEIVPYFSVSRLPITWSGKEPIYQFIIPPKPYLGNEKIDHNMFISFKPYQCNFYKFSFDLIFSGSWDIEEYKIKLNNKTIFKDILQFNSGDIKISYKNPIVKFKDNSTRLCDWSKKNKKNILTNNHDLIGHFEFTMFCNDITELQIFNGLDEHINNELLAISNIKIEQLPYYIASVENYNNKWEGLKGFDKQDIVATDQIQLILLSGNKIIEKSIDTLKTGKLYKLRIIAWNINTIDKKDTFEIYINGKKVFGNTLSSADENIQNCLNNNYTIENLIQITNDTYNLTTDKINEFYSIDKFNAIDGKQSLRAIIEIPFVSTGNDKIEIKTSTDQNVIDEAYGIEEVLIYSDTEDLKNIISDHIVRIETGKSNNWKYYSNNGIYIDVDTSMYGFKNPQYFTSLYGNSGNWRATGESAIYNATPTGFRVYIYAPIDNLLDYAKQNNWELHWMGVETTISD